MGCMFCNEKGPGSFSGVSRWNCQKPQRDYYKTAFYVPVWTWLRRIRFLLEAAICFATYVKREITPRLHGDRAALAMIFWLHHFIDLHIHTVSAGLSHSPVGLEVMVD